MDGNLFGELQYYFLKLPLFLRRISKQPVPRLTDIIACCPRGPRVKRYQEAIRNACSSYDFLGGCDHRLLTDLYSAVSAVREADTFLYPFLSGRTVRRFNAFSGVEDLGESYGLGPVLVLYAHTGSYYESIAATAELGYRVHPIAYGTSASAMETPLRWLLGLNMILSERHFSGGRYLYTNTGDFSRRLRRILSVPEKTLIYAAIDLPQSFITERRAKADFLGGETSFPCRLIEIFCGRKLPIFTAFPLVGVVDGRVKRVVRYEKIPGDLLPLEVVRLYASRLEAFVRAAPEQLLTLINLGGFFG